MLKIASAPHLGGSVARHLAAHPPPHSSVKRTRFPSLVNVAECQYAKFGSLTSAMRFGSAGLWMSIRIPLPEHAPAPSPRAGYTVMSWHWLVSDVSWTPFSVSPGLAF